MHTRFAKFGKPVDVGDAYVIYGTTGRFSAVFDLANLDAWEGGQLRPAPVTNSLTLAIGSTKVTGNVNGDGFQVIGLSALFPSKWPDQSNDLWSRKRYL